MGSVGFFVRCFAQMDDHDTEADVVDEMGDEPNADPSRLTAAAARNDPGVDVDVKASAMLDKHMERFLEKYEAPEFRGCLYRYAARASHGLSHRSCCDGRTAALAHG